MWLHRLQWLFLALIRELSTYLRRNCFSMFVYYEMLFDRGHSTLRQKPGQSL